MIVTSPFSYDGFALNQYFYNEKGFILCFSPEYLDYYKGTVLKMSSEDKFLQNSYKGAEDPLSFRWKHRGTRERYDYSE